MRAAIYARVSTLDQEPENQLQELRRYAVARGWFATEYVDRGVSGAKDRRPSLDMLVADAKRRRFDVVVCWRLDRLGRKPKALDHIAGGVPGTRSGLRIACGKYRRNDASRECCQVNGDLIYRQVVYAYSPIFVVVQRVPSLNVE